MVRENETKKFVEPSAECNNPAERERARARVGERVLLARVRAESVCGRLNGMGVLHSVVWMITQSNTSITSRKEKTLPSLLWF